MNRAMPTRACLVTLLALVLLGIPCLLAMAQNRTRMGGPVDRHGAPFVDLHGPMPKSVTAKPLSNKTRAVIPPSTIDLTPNTPTVADASPYWSRDEQFIVFQSNRVDLAGTTAPPAGAASHIYRMRADGSFLSALTGPLSTNGIGATTSQSEPAFNSGGSAVVYIETAADGSVDLMEYNVNASTSRSILKNNPQGFSFNGLNHPEYGFAIGGNIGVIFSGKRTTDASFHLFTVDTQSGTVTQLTNGAFDDRDPTLSPDPNKPVIAFDRTAAGSNGPRDIYVVGTNPNVQNVTKVTNFTAGGGSADNRQPAWSTNKVDSPTGNQQFVKGQQLLGFATTRVDTNNDGNANAIGPTHDIYWLKVTVDVDPNNPGVYTVTTPESTNNPAFKLNTNDPQHIYDDLHPTWPQFIATYRVAYQSDRSFYDPTSGNSGPAGQPTDIFASTLIDLNAPTLVRYSDITGEVVNVTPRITAPGSTVTISAKVADFETGVRDVWVQIKNPNSKYQSADGLEHKVYLKRGGILDSSNTASGVPVEYEYQRIYIGDGSNPNLQYSYADPTYVASRSDFYAFSGAANPPDASWLQLKFQSRDPQTGVSTYSAQWQTDRFPTDYYIDVIVYDNALNPFSTGNADPFRSVNWKIYDNVWGFTTQNFNPAHNILFVSDYAPGQKFFSSRFGQFTLTNVVNTFWGTESWMTDMDVALLPKTYVTSSGGGTLVNVLNSLGVKSYGALDPSDGFTGLNYDPLVIDGTKSPEGIDVPATQQYDIWRILCRGAVPDSVLQQYAPHNEQQPPDTIAGEKNPRTVQVASRCVIWQAPYTGDVFAGPGTLTDLVTQTQLHSFLASGGRLFVNGQDIGWALTLDGSAVNSFFSNDLRAQYVSDEPPGLLTRIDPSPPPFFGVVYGVDPANSYALKGAPAYDPISNDPWLAPKDLASAHHSWPGPPFPPGNADFISNETMYLAGGITTQPYTYGCPGVLFPDNIRPGTNVTSDVTYANANTSIQHYQDPATGQRLVYCAMGIEGLNPDTFTPPNTTNIIALKNRRAEIMHNAVCWLRTGTFFGVVRDVEAGNPLPGVLVRLYNKHDANGKPIIAYTAVTDVNGNYTVNGVEPDGWIVSAFKPGFAIQKATFAFVHGGFRSDLSFRMTKAEPDTITGHVFRTDGTTPIVGATVTATDNNPLPGQTAATFTAVTDANGAYSIERVPAQTTYTLTASAPNFGASIPLNYQVTDPNDPTGNGFLQPAKSYGPYDFQLKAQPGIVTGHVYALDANGNQVGPIANAVVTATSGATSVTATTDANGAYSFNAANTPSNGLDPGTWGLVATAPGFAPNAAVSVTVVSQQTVVAPDIKLSPVPPGAISGLVTRSSDNAPLGGVLIQVKDSTGAVVASTTTSATATTTNGYTFNYKIASVPAGVTYSVYATLSGYTAQQSPVSVAVTSGTESQNVNFVMDPLHTFPGALSLVSAPYDYTNSGQNAAQLLSASPSDPLFLFATWNVGSYVFFPAPPADTFHLGRGYFLQYSSNLPLSTVGTPANPAQPFTINLAPGWNMIGDPFITDANNNPIDIDWTKAQFQVPGSGTPLTYDQAVAQGIIGSALYSYQSGTYALTFRMSPWIGYWARAYQSVTLILDPTTASIQTRAATRGAAGRATTVSLPDMSRAVLRGGDGWSLNLRVSAGAAQDNANYLGVSSRAASGFDPYKMEKPPIVPNTKYAYLTFDHSDWGTHAGGYGVDVRPIASQTSWDFSVQTNVANDNATITWPNAATVARGVNLVITDLDSGATRSLQNSGSYSWNTGAQPATRHFRIEATRATVNSQLVITGTMARPTGTRASSTSAIGYTISQPANVEIRILGGYGQTVRRLSAGTTRAAGANQALWDQRDDRGMSVPSGIYTVEVKAQSLDGKSTARQVAPLIVTR